MIETFGLSQEQEDALDHLAEVEWKQAFLMAKQELATRLLPNLNPQIANEPTKTGLGNLVAVFDMRELVWLKKQYGDDVLQDRDFIRCYKRYREQGFLASV